MDLPSSNIKKSFIFSQKKAFLIFQERKPPKINSSYFRKKNFLIFRERYIQSPSMFRTRSIFRTLVCSEPVVYCRVTCTTFTTFAQAQKIKKSPPSKKKKKNSVVYNRVSWTTFNAIHNGPFQGCSRMEGVKKKPLSSLPT